MIHHATHWVLSNAMIILGAGSEGELGALMGFVILSSILVGGVWWVCRNDSGAS